MRTVQDCAVRIFLRFVGIRRRCRRSDHGLCMNVSDHEPMISERYAGTFRAPTRTIKGICLVLLRLIWNRLVVQVLIYVLV